MRVSQLMHTPAVTCPAGTTLRTAARSMAERDVGCILVVDAVGEVAGVVTDRDIAIRAVGEGRSADIAVDEVMSRDVVAVSPRADVSDAAAIMTTHRVRRLAVVDERGAVHGVLALDDLVRHLGHQAEELTELLVVQAARLPLNP